MSEPNGRLRWAIVGIVAGLTVAGIGAALLDRSSYDPVDHEATKARAVETAARYGLACTKEPIP